VSIVLVRTAAEVRLVVEDDGRGFEAPEGTMGAVPHLGLMGMEERAVLLKGEFSVYSYPGEGTTVRVRVPLDAGAVASPDEAPV
jgi:signal transduction histidine kinase